MTAYVLPARRPWTHRTALRLGRALTAWGARPVRRSPAYAERLALVEATRDSAARVVAGLPR
ncbi:MULTISPECIES: hypothetical protein [unclassified Leifsonia]|uniref:hypothetical protein n=1 Tax=unclassified Leifsonia TaxID=2663824 RepID=UPI000928AF5B|nr:hypothetical protein [Leifsonia sp. 71-9]OJX81606.1 MAG: hypothetical protein BGO91_04575 [Leifsonia sp. 71-9]